MIHFLVLFCVLFSRMEALIQDKVLICGICKDAAKAVPNTIQSATALGNCFADYRVVIYENNSTDGTPALLQAWAKQNPRVLIFSEQIDKKKLSRSFLMQKYNRLEAIARARNKVLDVIMQDAYQDYKYVVWADLDFLEPWDMQQIVETILHPEAEWDAVLANGAYDLFAFRDEEFPIGFELLGERYWKQLDTMRAQFSLDPKGPWRKVYSAFGGLGIYKREAMKGCRYAAVVSPELEAQVLSWLEKAGDGVCFMKEYRGLQAAAPVIDVSGRVHGRKKLPAEIGVRLPKGKLVWYSCDRNSTLPATCEHVAFHAAMRARGHDKIYVNPRLTSNHP